MVLAERAALQIQAFFSLAYISREAADRLLAQLIDEVAGWRVASPVPVLAGTGGTWAVTVAPRLVARLAPEGSWPLGGVWEDTHVPLPEGAPQSWTNVLTGERLKAPVALAEAFRILPSALLTPD